MKLFRQFFSTISSIGWLEFGFLWGLFFAPWGPVPRYLGWFISIVAWALSKKERGDVTGSLPRHFQWLLWGFISWAFFVTLLSEANLHDILKGASNPVEAAFAMWLAASVLRRKGAVMRCFRVLWATTALTGSWTIARYGAAALGIVSEYIPGPFSNINTLGGYAFPLCTFWFTMTASMKTCREKSMALSALVFSVVMLFLSFSILPWLATLVAAIASSLMLVTEGESVRPTLRGLAVSLTILALLLAFPGKPIARSSLEREISQVTAIDETTTFTNHRTDFVPGTVHLICQKPLTGWGWGQFENRFPIAQKELGLPPDNPLSPHNLYLGLLCESGLIGLLIFLGIVLSIFTAAWKFRKGERKELAIAILSLILAYGGYSLGGSVFDARRDTGCFTWFLLGSVWILKEKDSAGQTTPVETGK